MASTVKVFGGGAMALGWPGISYTGSHVKRAIEYNGLWYCEFILTGGGVLAADAPYLVDVYLIGGGGRGAAANENAYVWYRARPGGGSGFPVESLAQVLDAGAHDVVIGGTAQASSILLRQGIVITAAPGGNASAGNAAPQPGIGFTGEYRLYGDEGYPCGVGGGATAPVNTSISVPGRGGGGCVILPGIRPGASMNWRLSAGSGQLDVNPVEADYEGFGAGAMGGLPQRVFDGTSSAVGFAPEAAPGVCMIRVRM